VNIDVSEGEPHCQHDFPSLDCVYEALTPVLILNFHFKRKTISIKFPTFPGKCAYFRSQDNK